MFRRIAIQTWTFIGSRSTILVEYQSRSRPKGSSILSATKGAQLRPSIHSSTKTCRSKWRRLAESSWPRSTPAELDWRNPFQIWRFQVPDPMWFGCWVSVQKHSFIVFELHSMEFLPHPAQQLMRSDCFRWHPIQRKFSQTLVPMFWSNRRESWFFVLTPISIGQR